MRVIKNSHDGIGGIATEGIEMLRYIQSHPEHFLSLVHRDQNHIEYYTKNSPNTSIHYLILTKDAKELSKGVNNLNDLYDKYSKEIKTIEGIISNESSDISFCSGSFYYPWMLLQASKNKKLPISVRYAGIIEMEQSEDIWHKLGADFIDKDFLYIFPSEHCKKTLENIHNIDLPHAYVSPNGINKDFFNNKNRRNPPENFTIAFVGRLARVKNPEYFSRLSYALRKNNIRADFLGITDTSCLESSSYQRNVLEEWRKEGVSLLDFKGHKELADFYRSVNLIITPSHFETFGNVPLEAIATGTPALINKEVGVKEVFYDLGLDDLVLDFNDIDSVIGKIKEIKKEKRIVDNKVIKKIEENYNWDSIIDMNFFILEDYLSKLKPEESKVYA